MALSGFFIVAAGTGINAVHAVQKQSDPFPTIIGGVIFGTVCVALDTITDSKIGTMMAALFLLSSFLRNGVTIIDTVNSLINSPSASAPATPGTSGASGFTSSAATGGGTGGSSSGSF